MAEKTGISWADSTWNPWRGCTKVGPGCDHCYAETLVTNRMGGQWGAGAPRQRASANILHDPHRWQKKAPAFLAEKGHPRRVFCSSLADIFDNEVDPAWQADAFATMEATPDLRWLLCTKRVSNVAKMVPAGWRNPPGMPRTYWPQNVGLLITTVTPEEVARDVPRLVELKRKFGLPWVGLSIEPMIADVAEALASLEYLAHVDWLILGGESGSESRPCDIAWMRKAIEVGDRHGCSMFVKQMGDKPQLHGNPIGGYMGAIGTGLHFTGKGKDPAEWPADLRLQQFPQALMV